MWSTEVMELSPLLATLLLLILPTKRERLLTANILYETVSNPQTGIERSP